MIVSVPPCPVPYDGHFYLPTSQAVSATFMYRSDTTEPEGFHSPPMMGPQSSSSSTESSESGGGAGGRFDQDLLWLLLLLSAKGLEKGGGGLASATTVGAFHTVEVGLC